MSTYAFRDDAGDLVASFPEFAQPIPAHAQTPGALAAVESARVHGRRARLDRVVAGFVLEHGNAPPPEPYLVPEYRTTRKGKRKETGRMTSGVVTSGARALVKLAEERGFDVKLESLPDRCVVSGYRADAGFSCEWLRGRASSGTWHEPRTRYAMMHDTRPVGVSKLTRVGLAGKRPAGLGEHHLTIVASPRGVKIGVTAVIGRIKAL